MEKREKILTCAYSRWWIYALLLHIYTQINKYGANIIPRHGLKNLLLLKFVWNLHPHFILGFLCKWFIPERIPGSTAREWEVGQNREESSCRLWAWLPLWATGVQSSTHLRNVLLNEKAGVFIHQLPHELPGSWGLSYVWAQHAPRPGREMQKACRCIQDYL